MFSPLEFSPSPHLYYQQMNLSCDLQHADLPLKPYTNVKLDKSEVQENEWWWNVDATMKGDAKIPYLNPESSLLHLSMYRRYVFYLGKQFGSVKKDDQKHLHNSTQTPC